MPAWSELLVDYSNWKEHNGGAKRATVSKYLGYLERLASWYQSPPDDPRLKPSAAAPESATTEDLELFSGLVAHRAGLGPRSRKPLVAALKSFYRWAHRRGRIAHNPAHQLVYPDGGRRLPEAASIDSAERLIMAPDLDTFLGMRDAAIMATLIGTGIRVSGLVGLNEGSLIWTNQSGRQDLVISVIEKGGRQRLVPVPQEAMILIRAYLAHPELAEIPRDLQTGDRVLWVSTNCRTIPEQDYHGERRRLSAWSINDILERHGKRAGVPKSHRRPHAFRHLYGTELAEADIDILQRQALMGHADPKSTEIYTHLAMRKLRTAVDKANPLRRMRAPVLDSAREIARMKKS